MTVALLESKNVSDSFYAIITSKGRFIGLDSQGFPTLSSNVTFAKVFYKNEHDEAVDFYLSILHSLSFNKDAQRIFPDPKLVLVTSITYSEVDIKKSNKQRYKEELKKLQDKYGISE